LSSPLFFLKSLEGPKPLQEKDILLKGKYQYKDRNRTRIRRKLRKKKLRNAILTSTETGFTPGGEPPLVPVPHPGASIQD